MTAAISSSPPARCFRGSCSPAPQKSTSSINVFVQSGPESMLNHSTVRGEQTGTRLRSCILRRPRWWGHWAPETPEKTRLLPKVQWCLSIGSSSKWCASVRVCVFSSSGPIGQLIYHSYFLVSYKLAVAPGRSEKKDALHHDACWWKMCRDAVTR